MELRGMAWQARATDDRMIEFFEHPDGLGMGVIDHFGRRQNHGEGHPLAFETFDGLVLGEVGRCMCRTAHLSRNDQ